MLLELSPEWTMDLDRGPDWMLLRLRPPAKGDGAPFPLADMISKKLEQSFCYRLVLELDDVRVLRSWMLGELVRLNKRIDEKGGTLRLCGLSDANEAALAACGLFEHFPSFENRHDAVMGCRPKQPR
ncbi:MAG TPA: STAS domain-containing protein [Pirellulaceae bacterium]|nr:STAS domain-containing protein [Pirellulaceae bacterium]